MKKYYLITLLLLLPLFGLFGQNNAPRLVSSKPPMLIKAGQPYLHQMYAIDVDQNNLTYSAPTLPSWLSFDTSEARVSGIPSEGDVGKYDVVLRVSDGVDEDEIAYSITVLSKVKSDEPIENHIVNGDFEVGSRNGWSTWNNQLETVDVYEGNFAAKIKPSARGSVQQEVAVLPNTTYTAKVWAKVSKEGETADFMVVKNGSGVKINSISYKEYTFKFTTGSSQTVEDISVWKGEASYGAVYVDAFSLTSPDHVIVPLNRDPNKYYVDATLGNDNNDGLSPESAWRNLFKVNSTEFVPGDSVLFKSGEVWSGTLKLTSDGTLEAPIVYSRYGTGVKPQINGKGKELYTLWLYNADYTEVSEFDITNLGSTIGPGRYGVFIETENVGDIHNTIIRNLDIHDVNGSMVKNDGAGGGLAWSNKGLITSRLVDAVIEGCTIYNVARNGIGGNTKSGHNLRMKIKGNTIHSIVGDGIVICGCENTICEYNVCKDFLMGLPEGDAAAGIWPFNSINTIIQHNEVSGHKAGWDGQGFDSDYACIGTIIQYNYSHDNCGGFILICSNGKWNGYNDGSIIRYNISINDGYRTWGIGANHAPLVHVAGNITNTSIYNNTLYMGTRPKGVDRHFLNATKWNGKSNIMDINNNLFYSIAGGDFLMGGSTNNSFNSNLYTSKVTKSYLDTKPLVADPEFVQAGGVRVKDYQLKSTSPAIGAGVLIPNNGGHDFFGNPVSDSEAPNIGAYNGIGNSDITNINEKEALISKHLFNVYPNPIVNNILSVQTFTNIEKATISVCALSGKQLMAFAFDTLNQGVTKFNVSELRDGMYLIYLESKYIKEGRKFIKR